MNKIKEWLKEYQPLIIGLLILILMLKGCTSCQEQRRYEYSKSQYEYVIDSMQNVIDERSTDTKDLCDTIHSLRAETSILKDVIKDLREDKNYYRKTNDDLANVAKSLTKKDTLK